MIRLHKNINTHEADFSPPGQENERTLHSDPSIDTILSSTRSMKTKALKQEKAMENKPFRANPEVVAQYLEAKPDEIMAQMKSVDGRKQIFEKLMEHEKNLRKDHTDFNPEDLRKQLDLAGDMLSAKERFTKDINSPEKKGMLRRAWEKVKSFPRKHPVITTLLVLALAAGAIAGGFYLAGSWEALMASTGLNKIFTGIKAGKELIPAIPGTPSLPGGGTFEIPVTPGPDVGIVG